MLSAPYISHQKTSLAELPAQEEAEVKLPVLPSSSGATVRIPPELMPSDEQAMDYFQVFFAHIHPYAPVVNRTYFFRQWHNNRKSLSPLLLEAMFACAGRMSDDPAQGAQWLALASSMFTAFSTNSLRMLTIGRARRLVHGCSTSEYTTSLDTSTQG